MVLCSKCRKAKAVFSDRQSGLALCPACFAQLFEKKVWKANKDFQMLRRGDKIAVAISGGKDSAAMLHVLNKMAKKIGKIQLIPVLVDEGIVGYRPACIAEAKKLCKKEGLKLVVFTFKKLFGETLDNIIAQRKKLPPSKQPGACSICGVFRKKALTLAAAAVKANKLAVGHNLDDLAQTFLMNLLRNEPDRIERMGTGAGKAGPSKEGALRIRPLIYNPERECAAYSFLEKLPHCSDECPYSTEAFRGDVRDFLNSLEEKRPSTKKNLLDAWMAIAGKRAEGTGKGGAAETNGKGSAVEELKKRCKNCNEPSSSNLCKACEYSAALGLQTGF